MESALTKGKRDRMNFLKEILQGRTANHIAPFLWIHGDEEKNLKEEIMKIYEYGIRSLCVEARSHGDFNGPGWFRDTVKNME